MRKVRCDASMNRLKSQRGQFKIDAPFNWEPVEFTEYINRRRV